MLIDQNKRYDKIKLQSKIHKPQIIILSVCNSFLHAEKAKPFCDFAIGTKNVLDDQAGIAYAKGFYSILFNDKNSNAEVCHEAGENEIKYHNPPFNTINNMNGRMFL